MSLADQRAQLDVVTHFREVDRDLEEHGADIKALDERLGKILWTLVGILISTSTAAVLLALNLMVPG